MVLVKFGWTPEELRENVFDHSERRHQRTEGETTAVKK